jgi:hypothetical protein
VYFLGLPWLYTWGSGRFSGVARDAEYLAEYIKARVALTQPESEAALNESRHRVIDEPCERKRSVVNILSSHAACV